MSADGDGSVNIELTVDAGDWPPQSELAALSKSCLAAAYDVVRADGVPARGDYTVSILFTSDAAIRELNRSWRGRDKATNVLSFPQPGGRTGAFGGLLGDIALASETVRREAALERKPFQHHIAHLIVHGFLHLFGYDHEKQEDAELMEHLERLGLERIGIADPYASAVMKDD